MMSSKGWSVPHHGIVASVFAVVLCALLAAPAGATAEGDSTAAGTISITDIRDAAGGSIPAPMGLAINPFTTGPAQGPDGPESGTGALVYGGTAATSGTGVTTQVACTSAVNATASPAGAADGLETVSGSIQFINNSGQTLAIDVRFDWGLTARATVTDAVLETANVAIADVEFQESSGGSPTSPCNGGLLVDQQLNPGPAPPNDTPAPMSGLLSRTISLPDGETCSYTTLLQTTATADAAAAPVPTLPAVAAFLMLLALVAVAARWLGRRRPGTIR